MPDDLDRSRQWSLRSDPRSAIRTAVVWDVLDPQIANHAGVLGRRLRIVDVGGGTGGFAVPLAGLGHQVTVVDPSPDALAALQRRAADMGVSALVQPVQGDAGALVSIVGAGTADVVLCHGVLEFVDDPAAALRDARQTLREHGLLSLLVSQRLGAVVARAVSGRFQDARRLLDDPQGRAGAADPLVRRFDQSTLLALLAGEDLQVRTLHGVRLFSDLLPGALVDGDPDTMQALLELERLAGDHESHPELSALAAQLHVVAERT